jgi:hypothetical protein
MNLKSLVREMRLLALAGAVAFALGIGVSHAGSKTVNSTTAKTNQADGNVRIADGSESTGKPPTKPHRQFMSAGTSMLIADGSESTSKPPTKPKG